MLITVSLLHSHMNCRSSWNKIYHFASNMLPECSTVQLYSEVNELQNEVYRWLITVNIYQICKNNIIISVYVD